MPSADNNKRKINAKAKATQTSAPQQQAQCALEFVSTPRDEIRFLIVCPFAVGLTMTDDFDDTIRDRATGATHLFVPCVHVRRPALEALVALRS